MNREQRHLLFADNLPLVGYLVSDLCMKAVHLSREDLATAGTGALVAASNSYGPDPGVPFGTFARQRITGALAESMRDRDRSALSANTRRTSTIAFRETLAGQLGRLPTIDELASALGAGRDAVQKALADASLHLEPPGGSAAESLMADVHSPEYFLFAAENQQLLHAAAFALPCPARNAAPHHGTDLSRRRFSHVPGRRARDNTRDRCPKAIRSHPPAPRRNSRRTRGHRSAGHRTGVTLPPAAGRATRTYRHPGAGSGCRLPAAQENGDCDRARPQPVRRSALLACRSYADAIALTPSRPYGRASCPEPCRTDP
jgi:hypothetical protein